MRRYIAQMSLLLLTLLLTMPARAAIVDRLRAVVNGEVITQSDIEQDLAIRTVSRSLPANLSQAEVERMVLDQMISRKLLRQEIKSNPPEVTFKEVEKELAEVRSLYASPQEFTRVLEEHKISLDKLRASIEQRVQILKFIKERFHPEVVVTDEQVADYYQSTFVPEVKKSGAKTVPPLQQVAPEIRDILMENQINERMETFLRQKRRTANIKIL